MKKRKYFILLFISLISLSVFSQRTQDSSLGTLTLNDPLKRALKEYIQTIHVQNKGIALIFLTLNRLNEDIQVYRVSTISDISDVAELNVIQFCKIGDDYVFFSIAYSRQLQTISNFPRTTQILKKQFKLCRTNDYWEITIEKDRGYKINKKIKGHQFYRRENTIQFHPITSK